MASPANMSGQAVPRKWPRDPVYPLGKLPRKSHRRPRLIYAHRERKALQYQYNPPTITPSTRPDITSRHATNPAVRQNINLITIEMNTSVKPLHLLGIAVLIALLASCASVPPGSERVPPPPALLGHWRHVNHYRSAMSGSPFDGTLRFPPTIADMQEDAFHDALEMIAPELQLTPDTIITTAAGRSASRSYSVYRCPDGTYHISGLGRMKLVYSPTTQSILASGAMKVAGQDMPFTLVKQTNPNKSRIASR